jgi:hypothetical protein
MRGGFRPGAGRKKGGRNATTIAREELKRQASMRFGNQIFSMTALEMIHEIARVSFAAGNYTVALAAAKEALPFVAARLAPMPVADPSRCTLQDIMNDEDAGVRDEDLGVVGAMQDEPRSEDPGAARMPKTTG